MYHRLIFLKKREKRKIKEKKSFLFFSKSGIDEFYSFLIINSLNRDFFPTLVAMIIIFWFLFFSYLLSILNAAAIVLDLKVQLVLNNFNGILMVFFVSFPSRLHCLLHTATKSIFLKYSFKKIILLNLSVAYNHQAIKGLASTITIIFLWPICLSKLSSNTLIYHAHVSVQWASFLFWAHILHHSPTSYAVAPHSVILRSFFLIIFFHFPYFKTFFNPEACKKDLVIDILPSASLGTHLSHLKQL